MQIHIGNTVIFVTGHGEVEMSLSHLMCPLLQQDFTSLDWKEISVTLIQTIYSQTIYKVRVSRKLKLNLMFVP